LNGRFRALGRNIAPRHFKTDRVAETALRQSWFWPTWALFAGTWGISSSPRDSKLTRDGLGFERNGKRKNTWTLGFKLLGRNIAPIHFKTDRVAGTTLPSFWFWPTLARFTGTWGIFFIPRDSKLTRCGLGFQWNGQRKNIWTLGFELLGRSIATLHFKIDRVAETALRASWFWLIFARFVETWGIFSSPRDSEMTGDGLCFQLNGQRENIWTLGFEPLGQSITPLHFKTNRVAETPLGTSWFWPTLARFAGT